MKNKRVKSSFTLLELMLVLILISSSYFLIFPKNTFKIEVNTNISLLNIKEYLLENFNFENDLSLVCVDDKLYCYVIIDDTINQELRIENLFNSIPDVYEYNSKEKKIEFEEIRVNNISRDVFFRLDINNDYKVNELILDTLEDKVYVFNSLFSRAKSYDDLSGAFEDFNRRKEEVKDAF
jgi:hypothetical protein